MESNAKSQTESDQRSTGRAEAPTATEVMATQWILNARPHSTDVWSTARALNVLREESYNFGRSPVICRALEDAARYLAEFGEIRSRAECKDKHDRATEACNAARNSGFQRGCDRIMRSDEYREGELVIARREADKLRTETRKTSKKAVKRG